MPKKALITGITGQDGSYLAEYLLDKGYLVYGLKRRSSIFNTERIDHIYEDPNISNRNFVLQYGDLTDTSNIISMVGDIKPDEIYNLGAQSHVAVSFETPEYTSNVNALGTLRVLEAIRHSKLEKKCRFYQASTSELFGLVKEKPQSENTPFYPRSPYAASKLYAYWITINYREAYSIYACNGILFNHESKRRGETFVTRKITRGLSRIALGLDDRLYLGNLDSVRDWGHAKDYVQMQWLMLQQEKPDDYVIASGKQTTVRQFVEKVAYKLGIIIEWQGDGINEIGIISQIKSDLSKNLTVGDTIIQVSEKYFRPSEVDFLLGNAEKAKHKLGWEPKISIDELIDEMVNYDYKEEKKQNFLEKRQP